jgi:Zn-dependent peptidase ImmA (M78 family)
LVAGFCLGKTLVHNEKTDMKSPTEIASAYLENYWGYRIPVDPEVIARNDGVSVLDINSLGLRSLGLSGAYQPNNGAPTIYINRGEGITRQRFTCAHELGHRALGHQGEQLDRVSSYTVGQFDIKEVEANAFAAALLMPEWSIDAMIRDQNIRDVAALAELFDVSQNAMRFRLINLGWLRQ